MTRTPSKQPRSAVWWTVMALLAGSSVLGAAQAQTAARTATTATASASVVTQTAWHGQNQSGGFMMGRALNAVGATADQKSRIGAIMKHAATDLKTQRAQGRALRTQLTGLMTAGTVDTNAVENVRQQMLAVQNTVSQRRVQAQLAALAVLSPTQRTQLGAQIAQRQQLMQRQRQEREALGGARSWVCG